MVVVITVSLTGKVRSQSVSNRITLAVSDTLFTHEAISASGYKAKISQFLNYGKKFEKTNPDTAWVYYEKARKLAVKHDDQRDLSHYIAHALVLLNDEGKYGEGLAQGKKMVSIGYALHDTTILVKGYNDIANDYEYLGSLQDASVNYMTALRLADLLGNQRMQQRLNNNIASVFIELKDYRQANIYAGKSYQMAKAEKDTAEMGSSLINLGVTEIHLDNYELALKYFDQTIGISGIVRDPTLAGDARINKGDIYTREHKFQLARNEYNQVRQMATKYNLPDYNLYALFYLGVVDQQEHNYRGAVDYARKAIAIGRRIGATYELRDMYDTLSSVLQKMGNLKEALTYRKKFEILNDSIMSARVKTNINRLQIQYRAAQKDKEIAEQNLQLERSHATLARNKILLIVSGVGILVLLVFIILGYRYYKQQQNLQKQKILKYQREQEVIRLKALMRGKEEERRRIAAEMHDDIGSALTTIMYLSNNLKGTVEKAGQKSINKIGETAVSVVDKMNEIIWSMNKDYDTLEDLVTYIRHNAVELLEDNGICYQFTIPGQIPGISISGEKRRNIYLVVKEALHNIIKHANATKVNLEFIFGDELGIRICDNGKGIPKDGTRIFGNGLKNMKTRTEIMGGRCSISCNQGTEVHVEIPLNGRGAEFGTYPSSDT